MLGFVSGIQHAWIIDIWILIVLFTQNKIPQVLFFDNKSLHRNLEKTTKHIQKNLVGGWTNPFEPYAQVKLDHETPKNRVENKKYLSCHHLEKNMQKVR